MFTGIIEELGTINSVTTKGEAMHLSIAANKILSDAKMGDSIAVNGVCLTVTNLTSNLFSVDVMPETFKATSLSKIHSGSKVNLERALALGERLGGHFVTGHVDGVGTIAKIEEADNALNYTINLEKELLKYCIYKGSIAIDGTSLTIFGVGEDWIRLSLIPHTIKNTVIGIKKVGDLVNVECDMLAKYIAKLVNSQLALAKAEGSSITQDVLLQHGFI